MQHRLIFHIGFHRTGTSAIQRVLRTNRDNLSEKSVALVLREDIATPRKFEPQAILTNAEASIIIISEENLIGRMPYYSAVRRRVIFYETIAARVKKIAAIQRACDVRIVATVRRQDSWLESLYFYNVYKGLTISLDAFIQSVRIKDLDWGRYAAIFEKYGLRQKVAYFVQDRSIDTSDWLARLFSLPPPYGEAVGAVTANSTSSPAGTRVFLAMNKTGLVLGDHAVRRRLRALLWSLRHDQNLRADDALDVMERAGIRVTSGERATFERHFLENAQVRMSAEQRRNLLQHLRPLNAAFEQANMVSGRL